MNDPPLAKGDIGGFSKHLNPPLPPFSKGGDANKYMLRVIIPVLHPSPLVGEGKGEGDYK